MNIPFLVRSPSETIFPEKGTIQLTEETRVGVHNRRDSFDLPFTVDTITLGEGSVPMDNEASFIEEAVKYRIGQFAGAERVALSTT